MTKSKYINVLFYNLCLPKCFNRSSKVFIRLTEGEPITLLRIIFPPHRISCLKIAFDLGKSFTNTANKVFTTQHSYIQNVLHLRRPIDVFSQISNHVKKRAVHFSNLSRNNLRQELKVR